MPANNQLITFNDVAAEVAAGRMLWTSGAQSGTSIITWNQFTANVNNDGTNPIGYASNQCPTYLDCLNRAVISVQIPQAPTISDATGGDAHAVWTAPNTGPAPTSYDVQFYKNGFTYGAIVNTTTLSADKLLYIAGNSAKFDVRSLNGAQTSAWVTSNTITMS